MTPGSVAAGIAGFAAWLAALARVATGHGRVLDTVLLVACGWLALLLCGAYARLVHTTRRLTAQTEEPEPPPLAVDAADVAQFAAWFAERTSPIREAAAGQRTMFEADGWSAEAAEQAAMTWFVNAMDHALGAAGRNH